MKPSYPHISSFNYNPIKHVLVPVQMCNYVIQNNLESPFRLFILLKLNYSSGKVKLDEESKKKLSKQLKVCTKTIYNNFKKLEEIDWVHRDSKFKYWRLNSFERLRLNNDWAQRRAFPMIKKDLKTTKAVLGGIIYTQLISSYFKKFKGSKSHVLVSRSADKSITSFSISKRYARVAIKGVTKIFKISVGKAVRLKQNAERYGYIKVKKQFKILNQDQVFAFKKGIQLNDLPNNIVFHNGNYCVQSIDKIHSDIYFKKRKKLVSL